MFNSFAVVCGRGLLKYCTYSRHSECNSANVLMLSTAISGQLHLMRGTFTQQQTHERPYTPTKPEPELNGTHGARRHDDVQTSPCQHFRNRHTRYNINKNNICSNFNYRNIFCLTLGGATFLNLMRQSVSSSSVCAL